MKGFPNSLLLDIHIVYYFLTNKNNVVINIPIDKSQVHSLDYFLRANSLEVELLVSPILNEKIKQNS